MMADIPRPIDVRVAAFACRLFASPSLLPPFPHGSGAADRISLSPTHGGARRPSPQEGTLVMATRWLARGDAPISISELRRASPAFASPPLPPPIGRLGVQRRVGLARLAAAPAPPRPLALNAAHTTIRQTTAFAAGAAVDGADVESSIENCHSDDDGRRDDDDAVGDVVRRVALSLNGSAVDAGRTPPAAGAPWPPPPPSTPPPTDRALRYSPTTADATPAVTPPMEIPPQQSAAPLPAGPSSGLGRPIRIGPYEFYEGGEVLEVGDAIELSGIDHHREDDNEDYGPAAAGIDDDTVTAEGAMNHAAREAPAQVVHSSSQPPPPSRPPPPPPPPPAPGPSAYGGTSADKPSPSPIPPTPAAAATSEATTTVLDDAESALRAAILLLREVEVEMDETRHGGRRDTVDDDEAATFDRLQDVAEAAAGALAELRRREAACNVATAAVLLEAAALRRLKRVVTGVCASWEEAADVADAELFNAADTIHSLLRTA